MHKNTGRANRALSHNWAGATRSPLDNRADPFCAGVKLEAGVRVDRVDLGLHARLRAGCAAEIAGGFPMLAVRPL